MWMFRRVGVWVAALVFVSGLSGQEETDATALLERVRAAYAARPHFEVTAYHRDMSATHGSGPGELVAGGYRLMRSNYVRTVVTRRLPDDWRIVYQAEMVRGGDIRAIKTLVFGKAGGADGTLLLRNKETGEANRIVIPAALFWQELNERLQLANREILLFGFLLGRNVGSPALTALQNPVIEGTSSVDGVELTRVVARRMGFKVVRLWIDSAAGTVVRVVEHSDEQRMGIRSMMRDVSETIYRHDFTKGREDTDFDQQAGWDLAKPDIAAAAGFLSLSELFAALDTMSPARPQGPAAPISPKPPDPVSPSPPVVRIEPPRTRPEGGSEKAPTPAAPTPEPVVVNEVEIQQLSPEQMEAIVLIEGDEGVGTGFVAKIRGVDFVVTNLHVIGGNEKLRITTVRGVSIPVSGIFGAMGRDIAILRIEGENKVPALTLAADPLKTAKLGDKVAVVGNRRGGGVATQVSGVVRGFGPDRLEVDAPFQPGNSGSPIVHVGTGEVLGVASYSQKRKLDELDGPLAVSKDAQSPKEEQRWFGFRADEVGKWEAIDLAKWRAQAKRIADFAEDTEAIYYAMYGKFETASRNRRVRPVVDRFDERASRLTSQVTVTQEVGEFFRSLRALAQTGVKDLKTGEYYDFFRTSEYWETSITQQLRAREEIASRLDKGSENSAIFLSRLRR